MDCDGHGQRAGLASEPDTKPVQEAVELPVTPEAQGNPVERQLPQATDEQLEPAESESPEAEEVRDPAGQRIALEAAYQIVLNRVMAAPSMYERKTRDGCYGPIYYLIEMRLESRDNDWATETEAELRALWSDIDEDWFQVAVRCHSTICRIVAYWDVDHEDFDRFAAAKVKGMIASGYRQSDLTSEFSQVGSYHGGDPSYGGNLSVWVLRSKSRNRGDETESCTRLSGGAAPRFDHSRRDAAPTGAAPRTVLSYQPR